MFFMLILIFILIILKLTFYILDFNMSNLKLMNKKEVECGMFSLSNKNSSSSLYLLFLIIFLIFDLEVILILILSINTMNVMNMIFFMLINLSLLLELFENSLKWND